MWWVVAYIIIGLIMESAVDLHSTKIMNVDLDAAPRIILLLLWPLVILWCLFIRKN